MKRFKVLITVLAFVAMRMFISDAIAAISIAPDRHIVSLSPGEETVVKYQIYNDGNRDLDITIEPVAWSGVRDPYTWLALESDSAYLKAGESSPMVVSVFAPEDYTGEMVAMLFLCYKDTGESQLNIRNGVPLYLVIEGTEDYGLDIDNIEVTYTKNRNNVYDLNALVTVKNTGNVHIVPDIEVSISDDKGKPLEDMSLIRPNILLRGRSHTYRLGWRNPFLRDGIYTVKAVLGYEDKIAEVSREAEFRVSGNNIDMIIP